MLFVRYACGSSGTLCQVTTQLNSTSLNSRDPDFGYDSFRTRSHRLFSFKIFDRNSSAFVGNSIHTCDADATKPDSCVASASQV